MFLSKSEIWFFRDVGYQHDMNHYSPPNSGGRCSCEPTSIDENFHKLVPRESPQIKPQDTCLREILGGYWLKKREGWTMETEVLEVTVIMATKRGTRVVMIYPYNIVLLVLRRSCFEVRRTQKIIYLFHGWFQGLGTVFAQQLLPPQI